MPWFHEFASAAELAREEQHGGPGGSGRRVPRGAARGRHPDPGGRLAGRGDDLRPRGGEVRGHKQVRRFISRNQSWLAGLHARAETAAAIPRGRPGGGRAGGPDRPRRPATRLAGGGGGRVARRPVGDVPHVLQPVAGRRPRHVRPPILRRGRAAGRTWSAVILAALAAGDADAASWRPSPRTGTSASPSGPAMSTQRAAAGSATGCGRSSPAVRRAAAGSSLRGPARHRRRGALRAWSTTACAGAATTCRPRPGSRSSSAAPTGCCRGAGLRRCRGGPGDDRGRRPTGTGHAGPAEGEITT